MKKKKIEADEEIDSKRMTKNKKRKHKKGKKVLKIIIYILLLVISAMAGAFAYKVYENGWGLTGFLSTIVGQDESSVEELDKLQVLLLGESLNLTDTIIIASYEPQTQQISMLSIPRDTFTGTNKNKAVASQKINALYQISPEKTLEAVNKITGLEIKYYLCVDTKALRELVDKIGGVYFDVPIDMKYDDKSQNLHINLKAGYQLLDGDKAEQCVRFRHNNNGSTYPSEYGQEDIGRMRTQREFLKAVAKQTFKVENIFKINSLIDIYKDNVVTNLNVDLIKQYIPHIVNVNLDLLSTESLPGIPQKCNGVWLYIHDKEDTEILINKLFLGIIEGETTTEDGEGNIVNSINNTTNSKKNSSSKSKTNSINSK